MQLEDNHSDLVWGAIAIGKVIGRNPRQAFFLLENGLVPAKKVGERWVASRKKLLATLTDEGRAA
jgi:hypothetical protein